ncbi:MAG: hypothetical protein DMG22_19685, partial [Acidobacteria bacterium]
MVNDCPYKGLVPYGEEDARYFFGRDRERRLISASLRASRLTVLYGESGAGKSSVLAAGVAHDLRDDPEYALVLFRNWRDEPMGGLVNAVRGLLSRLPGFAPIGYETTPDNVSTLFQAWARATNRSLLIVLDQFEEYFQYHPKDEGPGTLAEELPRLLNRANLAVNFLIALREEALSTLDRFKGAIPNLFDNLLRVEHLSTEAAQEAIVKPLRTFNEELRAGRYSASENGLHPIEIEDQVAVQVVTEIVRAQGEEQKGVQAHYLQLVMTRWWEREIASNSQAMRLETLQGLGGVKTIVDRYLEDTLATLSPGAKEVVAEAFRYMVTPTGRKIAQTTTDLTKNLLSFLAVGGNSLEDVLSGLRAARLLREVPPPGGSLPGETCYEFAHDMVAKAAFEWRKQFHQAQKLAEASKREEESRRAQAERERAEEQSRQARKLRRLAAALGAMLLVAVGAVAFALWQKAVARARQLVVTSNLAESADPELSVLLAAESVAATWPWGHTVLPEAEDQLHRAVMASHVRLTLSGHSGPVYSVAWSPDGKRLATGSYDKTA